MSYLYQPATVCPSCERSIPNPQECGACERYADAVEVTHAEATYWRANRYAPLSPYWPDLGTLPAVRGLSAA